MIRNNENKTNRREISSDVLAFAAAEQSLGM